MMSPGARGGSYGPEPAPGSFLIIRILREILLGITSKDKLKVSHCARRGLTTSQSSDDKNFHNLSGQLLVASEHGSAQLPVFGSCCSVHQSRAPSVPQSPAYPLPVLRAEVNLSKLPPSTTPALSFLLLLNAHGILCLLFLCLGLISPSMTIPALQEKLDCIIVGFTASTLTPFVKTPGTACGWSTVSPLDLRTHFPK